MCRETGPVTRRRSACRGEATKWRPNRSISLKQLFKACISNSQPLQEPASTIRIALLLPKTRAISRLQVAASSAASSPTGGKSSVQQPVLKSFSKTLNIIFVGVWLFYRSWPE